MSFENIINLLWMDSGKLTLVGAFVSGLLIFISIHILSLLIDRLIDKTIVRRERMKNKSNARLLTLSKLASSMARYSLYILGLFIFLDLLQVNTRAFIATAGVGSLAIAMGAQTLVKDLIQGVFILFEDQFSVGDLVEAGGKKGYVQEVGVRVTKLRDFDGSLHIIPNSEIRIVTNQSRGRMRAKVVIYIDQGEDPQRVLDLFDQAMKPLRKKARPGDGPKIWGVTDNLERGYQITIVGYAAPGEHYDLEFDVRKTIVEVMKKENIAQPKWRLEEGSENGK